MASTQTRQRRKRDPESTRNTILEAAKTVLARDGAEGLSVSGVAQLAGVNRGTAYQHFETKEELIRATLDWVSLQLVQAVFVGAGDRREAQEELPDEVMHHLPRVINAMAAFNMRLAEFAVENPEISRIWLYDVLSRENPREDAFFQRFERSLEEFSASDAGQGDIDVEALAVLMLTGYFLWPVWARAHAKSKAARKQLAQRYAGEVLRLSMHGVVHADSHDILLSILDTELPTG